jgi:predicted DNA binding CopG/RHH family protein
LFRRPKKLSAEDKQLLWQQLFADEAIAEVKAFEASLKKKRKKTIRLSDDEITKLTTSVRRKNYEKTGKVQY